MKTRELLQIYDRPLCTPIGIPNYKIILIIANKGPLFLEDRRKITSLVVWLT
jgi:hypothetical protein